MSSRSSRVRTKVVALLVSLVALWAFAAFVTVRDGLTLLWVSTLDQGIAEPAEVLLPALQQERRLTLVYLGDRTSGPRQAMLDQRAETDRAANTFQALAGADDVKLAASPALQQRLTDAFGHLDQLTTNRARIDAGGFTRREVGESYTGIVDSLFRIYDSMASLDDEEIARDVRTLIMVVRATEVMSQEDALLAGALATGEVTATEHAEFVQLVGAQRFLFAEAAALLPAADRTRYEQVVGGATFGRFHALEEKVIQQGSFGPSLTVGPVEWETAVQPVIAQMRNLIVVGGDDVVARARPVAIGVIVRLGLAGGLGLIAVIASIIVSITTARALIRQLERLRTAARDLATYRLPRVVERLQHGEKVDVGHEAPPLDFGRDEIGQVGQAFNAVQETAVRVAVEQAELRRSVRDVFLSLARRSQALLHRQLGLLDAMERRSNDAEELAELFRIDHLATRMRRNAENLIVLSGATAGRAWRRPVPMVDVLRGALAEVEDYTRVTVLPVGSASLIGRAVGDVIHLLAELIENAVSFSPPQTVVRVGGSVVGYGFAIEIEDRGLGMSADELAAANEQLQNPPEFKLSSTARLGLYVVGKLAERHGIRVRLTESPYGGTTAIVLLPATLMAEESSDEIERIDAGQFDARAAELSAIAAGRHRHAAEAAFPDLIAGSDPVPPRPGSDPVAPPPTAAEPSPALFSPSAADRRSDPPILTPSGLPWRQRPSGPGESPAGSATGAGPIGSADTAGLTDPIVRAARRPDETRNVMSSHRSGTLRGRTDAARLADPNPPEWTPPAQESHDTDQGG